MESGTNPGILSVLENTTTANDSSPCTIFSLAIDLVHHILDFVPCHSHVDFACTCKHLLAYSSGVLKRHQDAQTKYSITSDLNPATIPTLLRSAFGYADPIPAWHVRSLEIWYERKSWDEWKALDFKNHIGKDTSTPIAWEYRNGEIDDYVEHVDQGNGRTGYVEQARTQIANGQDGILKAILLASLPRLREVKFVMPWKGEVQNLSCLGWLTHIINDTYDLKTSWGPGLSSLCSIAVGLESKTWMDVDYDPRDNKPNTALLLQLLRLPSIDRIYFKNYKGKYDHGMDYSPLIPPGSSSVKQLFLDNCDDLQCNFTVALTAAPASLLTAAFRAGPALLEDADHLVSQLGCHQGTSLQSLMFYNYDRRSIHGYHCNAFRPEELNHFRVLKHLCMNLPDIEVEAMYNEDYKDKEQSQVRWLRNVFVDSIPHSLEALMLWGGLSDEYIKWDSDEETGFEQAVMHPIHDHGDLKSVYLADVERHSGPKIHDMVQPNAKDHIWWRRAVKVGRKIGVDIHTLTNRFEPQFHHEFPEAMDEFDWATGPWGQRPPDWTFDVYSGRRRRMCGMCGQCEECLSVYGKEVWEGLEWKYGEGDVFLESLSLLFG